MSQKNIFPAETIEFSTEYHHTQNTVKSQIIYSSVVLSIIAVIISLPFIFIDVTIQADGLIRPVNEKTEIKPMQSGIVENIYFKENQKINKGDTILSIISTEINSKIEFANYQIEQDTNFIFDIKELLKTGNSKKIYLNISDAEFQSKQNKNKLYQDIKQVYIDFKTAIAKYNSSK